jgi:hypothetical protein
MQQDQGAYYTSYKRASSHTEQKEGKNLNRATKYKVKLLQLR